MMSGYIKRSSYALSLIYNLVQIVTWLFVFFWMLPQDKDLLSLQTWLDFKKWKMDHYWDQDGIFRWWLHYAQTLQCWDIIFCAVGITKNNLFTVFFQIISRLFVLYMIFPLVPVGHFLIFQCCMCWSFAEVVRFTFYTIKLVNLDQAGSLFQIIVGNLRYNSFVVLYPLGVSGELMAIYQAWSLLGKLPEDKRPFTYNLPNKFNISFNFMLILQTIIPLTYIGVFPLLFGSLVKNRAKYYVDQAKKRAKEALYVPPQFREFKTLEGLNKLVIKNGKIDPAFTKQNVTVHHKEGEVLLIDFWATWCQPCQQPMAHNQLMLNILGERWKGKVRIIGLSIDEDESEIVKRVNEKEWFGIEHYQIDAAYDKPNPMGQYRVFGVPHIMLVNKKGQNVFKGHPGYRKSLEQDIEALIRGEELQ